MCVHIAGLLAWGGQNAQSGEGGPSASWDGGREKTGEIGMGEDVACEPRLKSDLTSVIIMPTSGGSSQK